MSQWYESVKKHTLSLCINCIRTGNVAVLHWGLISTPKSPLVSSPGVWKNIQRPDLSLSVSEQRSQRGQPVHFGGALSSEGSRPRAALPRGGGHRGPAQLLLQTHLQCTETQGEDTQTTARKYKQQKKPHVSDGIVKPLPFDLLLALNIWWFANDSMCQCVYECSSSLQQQG